MEGAEPDLARGEGEGCLRSLGEGWARFSWLGWGRGGLRFTDAPRIPGLARSAVMDGTQSSDPLPLPLGPLGAF